MKRLILSGVALLCLIVAGSVFSFAIQPPCLFLKHPHLLDSASQGWSNPDSVLVDTCCSSTITDDCLYAKRYFQMQLQYDKYPFNHVLTPSESRRPSEMISLVSSLRDSLIALESVYGPIYFTGLDAYATIDTNSIKGNPLVKFYFTTPKKIVEIEQRFVTLPLVNRINYINRYRNLLYVPTDLAISKMDAHFNELLTPPGPLGFYPTNWEPMGYQTNIYNVDVPLAWELSLGKQDIFIALDDFFEVRSDHPDVKPNVQTPTNFGDGQSYGDLGEGHGLAVTSTAVAVEGIQSMIGMAPRCKSIAANGSASVLDVDQARNSYIKPPDVVNCSYVGGIYTETDRTAFNSSYCNNIINSGTVLVAAAGNNRLVSERKANGVTYYYPAAFFPAANIAQDPATPNNPDNDIKTIAVAAIKPGIIKDVDCNIWPGNWSGPNWSNEPQFMNDWNYSIGNDKFNRSTDLTTRLQAKRNAFVDIVAPGAGIFIAQGQNTYDINYGTSFAAPTVSGIVGLMLSINKYIGVPLAANGLPATAQQVQRKVYDIVTFTAKKIPDFENYSTEVYPDNYAIANTNITGQPTQYEYKTQWNDKLKRSWAQRVGFGLIDAYRCLAHSIMQKGQYSYDISATSYTLPFAWDNGAIPPDQRGYVNPDGKRLMHWGSKVKVGTGAFELPSWRSGGANGTFDVYTYGGVSLPGEEFNNQGVTKVNALGSQLNMQVPENCILAIDGILTTDYPTKQQYIGTTGTGSTAGKILAEGYIKDVEIYGNVKVGDLIIDGSYVSPTFGEAGCVGFGNGFNNEIYGRLETRNKGVAYTWGNITVQPGASILLNGEKNFILRPGSSAIVTMKNNTKIESSNRRIEINSTTKVIIPTHAQVDLDCEVFVANGGVLDIQEESIVRIKKLTVEKGGIVRAAPGAVIALSDKVHDVQGNLELIGTSAKRIKVTGKLAHQCKPYSNPSITDFAFISKTPTIFMHSSCDPEPSTLKASYTTFKNVALDLSNISVPEHITNCEFLASTNNFDPDYNMDYLVSIYRDNCGNCNLPTVTFSSCAFRDESGSTSHPADPSDKNRVSYNTGGLKVEGLNAINVINSTFEFLEFGISTVECPNVYISDNMFKQCGIGEQGILSGITLCNNLFNAVQFGSIRNHCYESKAYQNGYLNVRLGYTSESSQNQFLRGNSFEQYYRGILASNTRMVMNEIASGANTLIYGRNLFNVAPDLSQSEYVTKMCEKSKIADIGIGSANTDIQISCGYNTFSMYAPYHVYNEALLPTPFPTIDFNRNAMSRPTVYQPSVYLVNPMFNPSLVTIAYGKSDLEPCCGDRIIYDRKPCSEGPAGEVCELIMPYNMIKLSDPDNGDQAGNTNRIITEYQLAVDNNKIAEFSENYLNSSVKDSPSYGFLAEYLKNKLAKKTYFDLVKKQKGEVSDKTLGNNGSGLLTLVRNEYLKDCDESLDATDPTSFTGIKVEPNPSTSIAKITYGVDRQSSVSLKIFDNLGNTLLVKEYRTMSAGVQTFDYDVSTLTSGVYYVVIDVNGKVMREKIVVSK